MTYLKELFKDFVINPQIFQIFDEVTHRKEDNFFYCKICKKKLRTYKNAIYRHSISKKHLKMS